MAEADMEQGQAKAEAEAQRKRRLFLYKAAMSGDWELVKDTFGEYPEEAKAIVNVKGETVLHIAVLAMHTHFVKQLVQILDEEDLTKINTRQHIEKGEDGSVHSRFDENNGDTAFWYAARSGNVEAAKVMMDRNPDLVNIRRNTDKTLPISAAAHYGHRKMVRYLYDATKDQLEDNDLIDLLINLVQAEIYDIALQVVKSHPLLITWRDSNGNSIFHALAQKPHINSTQSSMSNHFFFLSIVNRFKNKNVVREQQMELVKFMWEEITKRLEDIQISDLMIGSSGRLILVAAEHGNVEFITILARSYPDVLMKLNDLNQTIFHIAVLNRYENIFKLIHELGSIKNLINGHTDGKGNNMLHLAGNLPSSPQLIVAVDDKGNPISQLAGYLPSPNRLNNIPGAALQLQHELMWFEEVKKVMSPQLINARNSDGLTPREVFLEKHQELRKEGEKWLRNTANSCMVVATLIATVVFAAAFTVPGGNRQDDGIPVFLEHSAFKVFAVSDAISLVSSVSTVLSFLSILTSRYSLDDFRISLPTKLILGIFFLFISVMTMMIAFVAAFFIIFKHGKLRFAYPIAAIASIPIFLFVWQHAILFYQVIRSTYISFLLFRPNKNRLFGLASHNSKKSN